MLQACDSRVREGRSARSPSAFRQIQRQTAARHSQDSDGGTMPSNTLLFIYRKKHNILCHYDIYSHGRHSHDSDGIPPNMLLFICRTKHTTLYDRHVNVEAVTEMTATDADQHVSITTTLVLTQYTLPHAYSCSFNDINAQESAGGGKPLSLLLLVWGKETSFHNVFKSKQSLDLPSQTLTNTYPYYAKGLCHHTLLLTMLFGCLSHGFTY